MLMNAVLNDPDALRLKALIQSMRIRIICRRQLDDALPAGAIQRLADHVPPSLKKRFKLFLIRLAKTQPLTVNLIREQLVKLILIVKKMPELLVVHTRNDAVGDSSCNLCLFLRIAQTVHLCNLIIHIARIIFDCALCHVDHEPAAITAALFLEHFRCLVHGAVIHLLCPFEHICNIQTFTLPFFKE